MVSPSDITYDVWTDGACAHKTSGAGGYGAVLVARRADGSIAKQWEVSGGEAATTNNRMELMAVVAGLRELPAPARVCIHIDSSYVMDVLVLPLSARNQEAAEEWIDAVERAGGQASLWFARTTPSRHKQLERAFSRLTAPAYRTVIQRARRARSHHKPLRTLGELQEKLEEIAARDYFGPPPEAAQAVRAVDDLARQLGR